MTWFRLVSGHELRMRGRGGRVCGTTWMLLHVELLCAAGPGVAPLRCDVGRVGCAHICMRCCRARVCVCCVRVHRRPDSDVRSRGTCGKEVVLVRGYRRQAVYTRLLINWLPLESHPVTLLPGAAGASQLHASGRLRSWECDSAPFCCTWLQQKHLEGEPGQSFSNKFLKIILFS